MAEPPRELAEAIIGEIIIRLRPDDPASLFRASAVCREWRAFCSDPDVLRRYRRLHKAPPVLGFLQNFLVNRSFFAVANPFPPVHPPDLTGCRFASALDCRHGRVLLHAVWYVGHAAALVVWNPITRHQQRLPDYPDIPMNHYTGAVLCAVGGCDHLDCRGGAFRVVLAATTVNPNAAGEAHTWASLYSSETGHWTDPYIIHPGGPVTDDFSDEDLVMGPSLLVGDALYFTMDLRNSRTILCYDLGAAELAVMVNPPPLAVRRDTLLVTAEAGDLGVAAAEGYSLHIWSWKAAGWEPWRVIDLEMMIPLTIGTPTTVLKVVGFAEMSRVVFVSANGIIWTLDLNSGQVRQVRQTGNSSTIYPCEILYTPTPAMEAA
ncbi:hypothetical protein BS78_10G139900 [Paspalum vaginatum]|nr:hypothetical protein BS78_10G139900 [Paspalum vaginatum]